MFCRISIGFMKSRCHNNLDGIKIYAQVIRSEGLQLSGVGCSRECYVVISVTRARISRRPGTCAPAKL